MKNLTWFVVLVLLFAAACSKAESKQTTSPDEVVPVQKLTDVAPAVAPAPTLPSQPARPASNAVATALAFMKDIGGGRLPIDRLDPSTTFAFVDYSTTPQGRAQAIEKGLCSFDVGLDAIEKIRKDIVATAPALELAFSDDRVHCEQRTDRIVRCEMGALGEGEATTTYEIRVDGGATLIGFARRETFMIDDEARLARDVKRLNAAFAKFAKQECLSEAERDAQSREARGSFEPSELCCCTAKGAASDEALDVKACAAKGGTCVAEDKGSEECRMMIHDIRVTDAKSM